MDLQTVIDYQNWAKRGYVTALICFKDYLDLIPILDRDGIVLVCPKLCSRRILGLGEYKILEKKTEMAVRLFYYK